MLSAVGSTLLMMPDTPGVASISAAEVVPSGLVLKIGEFTAVLEPEGLTPLRALRPCTFPNHEPPRNGMGPLPLKPSTFCRNFPRFVPDWLLNHSLAFSQSLRCCQ